MSNTFEEQIGTILDSEFTKEDLIDFILRNHQEGITAEIGKTALRMMEHCDYDDLQKCFRHATVNYILGVSKNNVASM